MGEAPDRHAPRSRNLFLAGDYVQTDIDLATMEGANESARAAVNAMLEEPASGSAGADVPAAPPGGVGGAEARGPAAVPAGPQELLRRRLSSITLRQR